MEYIYAAMILHKAGKKIEEAAIKKILEAAGVKPDDARVKALVASLEGIDINKAIEKASAPVAVAAMPAGEAPKGEKKAEEPKKKEEDKKAEEAAAAAGLGALFG
ncbi:MAG: 50S ribosomal protein P1 [Candidatus Pacearchaeota archaeon]